MFSHSFTSKPVKTLEKPLKKFNRLETIRRQNTLVNKMKTEYSKALKMNEQDYMRSFKDKAAKVTTQLNVRHPGEGSSALFNLNM